MMGTLTIFTADYEPQPVFADDGADSAADADLAEAVVRYGDGPLPLLIDRDPPTTRIAWYFRGRQRSVTNRTEYFVATFRTEATEPLTAFADALESVIETGWHIPHTDDLRWDFGLVAYRVETMSVEPDAARIDRLNGAIDELSTTGDRIVLGARGYVEALGLLRPLFESDTACRIAVGTGGEIDDADIVIEPDADRSFEPRSAAARAITETGSRDPEPGTSDRPFEGPRHDVSPWRIASALAGAGTLALLALAIFSVGTVAIGSVGMDLPVPFRPVWAIATLGGFAGIVVALGLFGPRLTAPRNPLVITSGSMAERIAEYRVNVEWVLSISAYGTVCGLAFPVLFEMGGTVVGDGPWVFGHVQTLDGGLPSLAVFLAGVFVLSLALVTVTSWTTRRINPDSNIALSVREFVSLAGAHLLYGLILLASIISANLAWQALLG